MATQHLSDRESNDTAISRTKEQRFLALINVQRALVEDLSEALDLGKSFAVFLDGLGDSRNAFIYNTLYNIF
jgi:hypothetical protein